MTLPSPERSCRQINPLNKVFLDRFPSPSGHFKTGDVSPSNYSSPSSGRQQAFCSWRPCFTAPRLFKLLRHESAEDTSFLRFSSRNWLQLFFRVSVPLLSIGFGRRNPAAMVPPLFPPPLIVGELGDRPLSDLLDGRLW